MGECRSRRAPPRAANASDYHSGQPTHESGISKGDVINIPNL